LRTLTPAGGVESVQRMRFSEDSSSIAVNYMQDPAQTSGTVMHRGVVKIWDMKTRTERQTISPDEVPSVTGFSQDGRVFATASSMGAVSLWDAQSGNKLFDLTSSPMKPMTNLPPFPQPGGGRRPNMNIAMPNMADIANMMTNVIGTMAAGTMNGKVSATTFSPDGRVIAVGGLDAKANVDIAAMMSGAMNQKPKKGSKQQNPAD